MFIVGLTGGIGCGKSTIEKFFLEQGKVAIIDTDIIVRNLQEPGKAGFVYIKQAFGDNVIDLDGSLNRKVLRKLVFDNKEAKTTLETIMSPLIYHVVMEQLEHYKKLNQFDYAILTVPLLLESKVYSKLVDRILVVDCPEQIQIERVMTRSNMSKKEVEKIIAAQSPRYFKILKANDVIQNYDCSLDNVQEVVKELHQQYCKMAKEKSIIPV